MFRAYGSNMTKEELNKTAKEHKVEPPRMRSGGVA